MQGGACELIYEFRVVLKAYLLHQKVGPNVGFISFSQMALLSGRIFTGFKQHEILYETSKYLPGHQCHLGEAIKTNV